MKHRMERDSLGEVLVPQERRWGAQTQRSLENFPIGEEKMPLVVVKAIALIKKAAAVVNQEKDCCHRKNQGSSNRQLKKL